jgi:hypothetical protein
MTVAARVIQNSAQPGWAGDTYLPIPKSQPPVPTAVPTPVAHQVDLLTIVISPLGLYGDYRSIVPPLDRFSPWGKFGGAPDTGFTSGISSPIPLLAWPGAEVCKAEVVGLIRVQ